MLDILFLGRVFPERTVIMAKKELKYSPLLGQYSEITAFDNS
jgi:lysophosphatidate acyltransferase